MKVALPFTHCKCHMRFNERGALFSHNGSFSARLNVSPNTRTSPPFSTSIVTHIVKMKNKFKGDHYEREGWFGVACRKVSLRISTCNTEVLSYLISIHSHNEQTSSFPVTRVQTRLLFSRSSDMCMLLPSEHGLGPPPDTGFRSYLFSLSELCMFQETILDKCLGLTTPRALHCLSHDMSMPHLVTVY